MVAKPQWIAEPSNFGVPTWPRSPLQGWVPLHRALRPSCGKFERISVMTPWTCLKKISSSRSVDCWNISDIGGSQVHLSCVYAAVISMRMGRNLWFPHMENETSITTSYFDVKRVPISIRRHVPKKLCPLTSSQITVARVSTSATLSSSGPRQHVQNMRETAQGPLTVDFAVLSASTWAQKAAEPPVKKWWTWMSMSTALGIPIRLAHNS